METGEQRERGCVDWGCTGAALCLGCSGRNDTRSALQVVFQTHATVLHVLFVLSINLIAKNNHSQCQSTTIILIRHPTAILLQ